MEEVLPDIKKSVLLLLGGFALGFLVAVLYSLGYLVFTPGIDIQNTNLYMAMLIGEIIIPVPALIWGLKNNYNLKRLFRLNSVDFELWLPAIITSFGGLILLDELDRLISIFFPMPEHQLEGLESLMQIKGVFSGIMIIGVVVIIGPLVEEIVFRGFFQRILEKRMEKLRYSILISAACFALLHFNPWWVIQICIMGILLAYFAYYSNSIFLPLLLHALNNGTSVLLMQYPGLENSWYTWNKHVNPFLLIGATVAFYFGIIKIIQIANTENITNTI